mmetsp:Transcript_59970/g.159425  ORF Transcript_59970/g.159425 Transcript_59970/m.159425 type:complete len:94 (+) Transcript_59970:170-451(+)
MSIMGPALMTAICLFDDGRSHIGDHGSFCRWRSSRCCFIQSSRGSERCDDTAVDDDGLYARALNIYIYIYNACNDDDETNTDHEILQPGDDGT